MIQHYLEPAPNSELLMGIINAISDPLFVKNESHQLVLINEAFCQLLGLSAKDILGKTDYEIVRRAEAEVFTAKDKLVFETEKININEEHFINKLGEERVLSTKKSFLKDENGNKFIIGIVRDITEIKRYENELETLVEEKTKEVAKEHAYLRHVIDSIPNLIFAKDRKRQFTLANKAFQYAFKGKEQNLIGKKDHNLYLEEDLKVLETGNVVINDKDSYIDPITKQTIWISTNKTPLKNEKGEIIEIVCISTDISQQVIEEEERKSTERKYQLLLETLPGTVCEIDDKGNMEYVSPEGMSMFGYKNFDDLPSKNIFDYFVKHEHEQVYQYWEKVIAGKPGELLRIEAIHRDGHTFYLQGKATLVGNPKKGHSLMFFYDISDKVKAEQKLLERESLLNSILNSVPDNIWAVDRDTNLIAINTNCQKTLKNNFRIEANIGDKMRKIIEGNQVLEKYWSKFADQILEGEAISFSYVESSLKLKGKKTYRDSILAPIRTSNNEIIGTIGISRNVTKRKEHELALIENENKYRTLFENSPYGVVIVDLNQGRAIECNQNWCDIMGYDKEIMLSLNVGMVRLSPLYQMDNVLSQDKYNSIFYKFKEANETQVFEWIFKKLNGETFWAEVHFVSITLNQEELMMVLIRDIDDKKKAQQDLAESELLFRSIFDNAYDGIAYSLFDKDTKTEISHHPNQKMLQLYDFSMEEYEKLRTENTNIQILYSPNLQKDGLPKQVYFDRLNKELQEKKSIAYEWILFDKRGENKYLDCTTFLVDILTKTATISILKDITKRKKYQETIQLQLNDLSLKNKELQKYIKSNMQLENFAYMASHDLQSPLKTITTFATLLQDSMSDRMTTQEREFCAFIMKSIQNLQALIQDLLAYSRANTEKLKVEEIDISQLLITLQEELKTTIQETKAYIQIEGMPVTIKGDNIKLKQLFQNLIINAIKFVKPDILPSIYIGCKEQEKYWQFSVEDNGVGIAKEFYEKVFLIFKRLHLQEEYKGTGIGLALCKKIVEQHNGTIWINSKENVGSIFYFTISKRL